MSSSHAGEGEGTHRGCGRRQTQGGRKARPARTRLERFLGVRGERGQCERRKNVEVSARSVPWKGICIAMHFTICDCCCHVPHLLCLPGSAPDACLQRCSQKTGSLWNFRVNHLCSHHGAQSAAQSAAAHRSSSPSRGLTGRQSRASSPRRARARAASRTST